MTVADRRQRHQVPGLRTVPSLAVQPANIIRGVILAQPHRRSHRKPSALRCRHSNYGRFAPRRESSNRVNLCARWYEALGRDLEAARYAAERAFRQFDAADAANRLVSGELETRWNKALTHRAQLEARIAAHDAATPAVATDPVSLGRPAADLKTVWSAPTTDARLKKRIVRTLIREVVADIDDAAAEIVLFIHWSGGLHSEMRLPRRRRGQRNSTSVDVIAAVRQLVLIASDDLITSILNRNGLVTGSGNRWTRERVTSMRSHYRILVFKPAEDGIEPWLNLKNAADPLEVAPKTLRRVAETGEIQAIHPLPEGPWIFARAALTTAAARSITERARQNPKHPAGSHTDQQSLFPSMT